MSIRSAYRAWRFQRRIRSLKRVIAGIDRAFCEMEWPRWKRKQFWSDFIRSNKSRIETIEYLDRGKSHDEKESQ